jgi:oligopeptide transport system substrate-binding protein
MKSPVFKKLAVCIALTIFLVGCAEVLQNPKSEPFYGNVQPPPAQEFRWSNGGLPQSFDPAKAVAPPEADVVRAIFEGLTDLDAKTLRAVSAAAEEWEATEDFRTWTFYLRREARWTNGKTVTAKDFVSSWRRVVEMNEKSPNRALFANIVGAKLIQNSKFQTPNSETQKSKNTANDSGGKNAILKPEIVDADEPPPTPESRRAAAEAEVAERAKNGKTEVWFGVEAVDDFVLRVWLVEPDKNFPALVAHPAFRPIFESDAAILENTEAAGKIVSNGAFRIAAFDKNGVSLEKNKNYWQASAVELERARLIPAKDAESALAAYRAGELDAVTNANFEPLAAKLLTSYKDFRRAPYNAIAFYEFNQRRAPFGDKKVREALALAIDRERLTADEMDGAVLPAKTFLPQLAVAAREDFAFDLPKAKKLLKEAGFENGKDFPKIRLLVNRNDLQRRVARAVAAQWRKNLGVETEVIVSSFEEIEAIVETGDFDIVRRTVVLPTTNELSNLQAMFGAKTDESVESSQESSTDAVLTLTPPGAAAAPALVPDLIPNRKNAPTLAVPHVGELDADRNANQNFDGEQSVQTKNEIFSESEAVELIPAIPLYFPASYALVKPYVAGFETNLLDAPLLKNVKIETAWQRSNQ